MLLSKYCKSKGLTKEEYKQLENNIKVVSAAIASQLKYKGGMYYPTEEIIKYNSDPDMKGFIIQELKKLNIEFIKNDTYYRVVS